MSFLFVRIYPQRGNGSVLYRQILRWSPSRYSWIRHFSRLDTWGWSVKIRSLAGRQSLPSHSTVSHLSVLVQSRSFIPPSSRISSQDVTWYIWLISAEPKHRVVSIPNRMRPGRNPKSLHQTAHAVVRISEPDPDFITHNSLNTVRRREKQHGEPIVKV